VSKHDYGCKTTPDSSQKMADSVVSRLKSSQGGTGTDKASVPQSGNNGVTKKMTPKTGY
jgi:hypothetical protein